MSASYREQGLKAKEARIGIVDQRVMPGKNKKPRPVIVECRHIPSKNLLRPVWGRDWSKWGAYRNEAEAEAAIAKLARKYVFNEYRIKP